MWLWWHGDYYTSAGDRTGYLCACPPWTIPETRYGQLYDEMDYATEFVNGVFIDQTAEIALVIVSKPSTRESRYIEYYFDGTVGRIGPCDFYGSGNGAPAPIPGAKPAYFMPLGPCQQPTGVQSGTYDFANWSAFSFNSGGKVDIFQIDGSGTLKFVKFVQAFNAVNFPTIAGFGSRGEVVMAVQDNPGSSLIKLSSGFVKTKVGPQMNPAHIIREVLTNGDWSLGIDEDLIDDVSFKAAADTLYSEGFGLSLQWTGQSSAEDFINDILGHIDATYGNDPATGKFYIKLIRGDYDPDDLDVLTEDDITITSFVRNSMSDTSNEVVVTWTNPENEGEQTVTVHDIANYSAQGVIISTSRNYHAIRTSDLALRCAMRELGKVSQPIATFEVEANRMAINYKSGDVVKINYPEYGLNGLPCRVMTVNRGKPGQMAVKMTLMEDVFNMPSGAYVSSPESEWEDTGSDNLPINLFKVESAPYYLVVKEIGDSAAAGTTYPETYAMILAAGPGAEYGVYTPQIDPLGNSTFTLHGSREYAGTATLGVAIGPEVRSTLTITGQTIDPATGTLFFLGDELCIVETYFNGVITARRGMLDTVPVSHAIGERLWFFTSEADIADPNTYSVAQVVNYRLVPEGQTTSGAMVVRVTMTDRMYRPYRPANVKVNGSMWPTVAAEDLMLTWSHRNRLLETSVLNKWDEASVTAEVGTTYNARVYGDGDVLLSSVTGITGDTYTWNMEDASTATIDPVWDNVSLLTHFDGSTFVDETGKTLTPNGTAALSTAQSVFGGSSGYFNGKTNHVTVPAHTMFDFGTGDFTVEFFGRLENLPGPGQYPSFIKLNVECEFNFGLNVGLNGGYLYASIRKQNGDTIVGANADLLSVSTWYHLAVQRLSGTFLFFVNGTRQANMPGYGDAIKGGFTSQIGYADGVGMYIDELRITKGVARYPNTPTVAVPAAPFPSEGAPGPGEPQTIPAHGNIRVELEAVRDGYVSLQKYNHAFDRAGYGLNYGEYYGGI